MNQVVVVEKELEKRVQQQLPKAVQEQRQKDAERARLVLLGLRLQLRDVK